MQCIAAQSCNQSRQPGNRSGLTLIELLLVLAILLAVGAVSLPSLQSAMKNRDMETAAQFVREKLDDGRRRAIDTGFVYQFRYEPGGSRFVIIPDLGGLSEGTDGSKYFRFSGEIYTSIAFQEELDSPGMGETLDRKWFEGLPDQLDLSRTGWSKPVEFTFEGQAENSTMFLVDDADRSIKLTIRGLTGGVRIGRIQYGAINR